MILAKFKTTVKCFLVLDKGSQILSHIVCIVHSKKVASLEKILVFNKNQLTNESTFLCKNKNNHIKLL